MVVLPGVLGCRPLRRTVQVRLGPIPRYRGTVARWHNHLHGLATAIHEIFGLSKTVLTITGMKGVVVTSFFTSWLTAKKSCKIIKSGLYLQLAIAGCHNF
jgi:hypothetical protein